MNLYPISTTSQGTINSSGWMPSAPGSAVPPSVLANVPSAPPLPTSQGGAVSTDTAPIVAQMPVDAAASGQTPTTGGWQSVVQNYAIEGVIILIILVMIYELLRG